MNLTSMKLDKVDMTGRRLSIGDTVLRIASTRGSFSARYYKVLGETNQMVKLVKSSRVTGNAYPDMLIKAGDDWGTTDMREQLEQAYQEVTEGENT